MRVLMLPLLSLLLSACATPPAPTAALRPETVFAVTDRAELIRFNAGQPERITARLPLLGLPAGEKLVGIDFRVARGVLYAVSSRGQLYTLNTESARLTRVGDAAPLALQGNRFGVDFNPAADRVRVVSDQGQNLRLHPDTGAVAATDPTLTYAPDDAAAGRSPQVSAAGYTYNPDNDKLTTNYAIDLTAGTLVMQGSREGQTPVVSPNTGQLRTVGSLGVGALEDASLDISDVRNTPLAALRVNGQTRLYVLDLGTGQARLLGTVSDGRALWGMAIEP
ncbi:DUF4394 domain-containing protein [Aquabacterium sp.]|uniref:DUF4394 domain-containing protein n=1 Tax=Aquabacterium sp. TaxID=1872578 RepID=UPI0027BA1C5B|nr:DUF4394 domain-containing protein [Aquabacterium sp.]